MENNALAYCPAVPLKENMAGCPGTVMATLVGVPGTMGGLVSLKTDIVTVALPGAPICDEMTRIYVPVTGNAT